MTNNNYRLWLFLLFFAGVCVLGVGCATNPKPGDESSSDDENFTSELFRSDRLDRSDGKGGVDKGENEPERGDPVGSDSKPEITDEPKTSINQLSNNTKQGNTIVPRTKEEVDLDPELSSEIEGRVDSSSPSPPGSLPREKDGDKPDSRSPLKEDAEGGSVSDSGNTPKKTIPDHGGDDPASHPPGSLTAPGRDKDENKRSVEIGGSSASLVDPTDSPRPPKLSENDERPGTFDSTPSDGRSGVSALNDSDTVPGSGSNKTDPVDDLVTPSLPGSISPELSKVVVDVRGGVDAPDDVDPKSVGFATPLPGEPLSPESLPVQVTDGVRADIDAPNDVDVKSVGFATPLPGESLSPESLSHRVGFGGKRSLRDEDLPAGASLKVALSGEETTGIPSVRSGSSPAVRFFDRKNGGVNRPVVGNGKTLGFSDHRPNARFLQRQVDPSLPPSKNVLQSSGTPNDYNSLRNFLSTRNKLGSGGSGSTPSTGNYLEAEKFLETIDSSKTEGSPIFDEDGTSPDDARYQNALEWLRSRGQGVERKN
ncbi:MAG: hypothetical protein HN531_07635 [Opitutae bacterium]|nr:hypothetical protein [Opitutae bacterium]